MKYALCGLAAALALTGTAHAQTAAPSAASDADTAAAAAPVTNSALDAPLLYEILLGELNVQGGEAGQGYSLLLDAARRSNDAGLYQRAVEVAISARAGDAAVQAAQAWRQAQPQSRQATAMLLQLLVALNRLDDVPALLASAVEAAPPAERGLLIAGVPRFFARTPDRAKAAGVVEQALEPYRRRADTAAAAWVATGRMQLLANRPDAALAAVREAQAAEPMSEDAALLAIDLMGPNQPLAQSLVQRYVNAPGADPAIVLAYGRALLRQDRRAEALAQFRRLTETQGSYAPAWLAVGLMQAQGEQPQEARAALMRYLELAPTPGDEATRRGATQALLTLARLAQVRGDTAEAQTWLDRVPSDDDNLALTVQRANLLARQGRLGEAQELIRSWPERSDDDARTKLIEEMRLLRDNGQAARAYEVIGKARERWPDEPDLAYDQALLAEKLGDFPTMERLLRELIARHPNYHQAYNALGYSLADRKLKLDEARSLILKALSFAPDDPMILDSLGWVEFRRGQLDEALRHLEKAYAAMPDAEIGAHLGEVLWQLGRRERALEVWRASRARSPDNTVLQQTLQRLKVSP